MNVLATVNDGLTLTSTTRTISHTNYIMLTLHFNLLYDSLSFTKLPTDVCNRHSCYMVHSLLTVILDQMVLIQARSAITNPERTDNKIIGRIFLREKYVIVDYLFEFSLKPMLT